MSQPPRTLRRLERILTMVPWLLEHPGVPVDEVAERFGVSRRELAQDLDILGYCGVPGYGGGDLIQAEVFGDVVTVRLADFFARPLRLSVREAVTLLLAARALAQVEAGEKSEALQRAAGKLETALGTEGVGDGVVMELSAHGEEHLAEAHRAVEEGSVLAMTYRSASKAQTTEREVEPWGVVGARGAWYLRGYCRLAEAPRDFRLDRVRSLNVTGETAPAPETRAEPTAADTQFSDGERARSPLHAIAAPSYVPGADDLTVMLELAPEAAWLEEWAVVDEVTELDAGRRVSLRVAELEWAARLVVRLGTACRVVSPPALADRVAELAAAALHRYGLTGQEAQELPPPGR